MKTRFSFTIIRMLFVLACSIEDRSYLKIRSFPVFEFDNCDHILQSGATAHGTNVSEFSSMLFKIINFT
jgi:hypothetical protein